MIRKLLIATHNKGKLHEYNQLLTDLELDVRSLDDERISFDVDETGATFHENACLKAAQYSQLSGLLTWADDSGIEIDGLDGRPGVYSARYGGPGLTSQQRYELALEELRTVPRARWRARFVCVVALAFPNGEIHTVEATTEGVITDQPRGSHGFGYDPIFFVPEYGKTMAELEPAIKNQISHRGKAAIKAKQLLSSLLT